MPSVKPKNRKESCCRCSTCKAMCLQSPCFPTPEDVEKLIAAGHKDKLSPTAYGDLLNERTYYLVAPTRTKTGCVFQDLQTDLCELHDSGLKPLEGKLAIHDQEDNGLRAWVANKWMTEAGLRVFELFLKP